MIAPRSIGWQASWVAKRRIQFQSMLSDPSTQLLAALQAWGPRASVTERLSGARNEVWAVRLDGRRYAARLSKRAAASIEWELRLLRHLDAAGLNVPVPQPACNDRQQVDGLVLFSWIEGEPPATPEEWRAVADTLTYLHRVTRDWPQRPGFRPVTDLVDHDASGDAHLDRMPPELVSRLRAIWSALAGERLSVVRGDPGAGNIRIQRGNVGLLDWDEAHVDVSLLDISPLPPRLSGAADEGRMQRGRRAAIAWEIANAWLVEPRYARRLCREMEAAQG